MLSLCMQFSKYSPVTFQILESAGSEQTGSRISGRNIRMILPVSYYIVLCKRNQVLFTNLTKKDRYEAKSSCTGPSVSGNRFTIPAGIYCICAPEAYRPGTWPVHLP